MSEREKHYIIVPEWGSTPYLDRGYERSEQTAIGRLGTAWYELPTQDRKDLIVLEIDKEKHEQLNASPRRYAVRFASDYFVDTVSMRTLDLLEDGSLDCYVADAEGDAAVAISASQLFLTEREAFTDAHDRVRAAIVLHKAAIENLEQFLRSHT